MDSLLQLSSLVEQRIVVLRKLAESLEFSRTALAANDAEAIARGAAHQAELCRQWAELEQHLQREPAQNFIAPVSGSPEALRSAQLQQEWVALSKRIRYLTRVHWSLLRHFQRSAAVLAHVLGAMSPTYTPANSFCPNKSQSRAGD